MDRPACPTCGTTDERPPDAFGVHRCSACAIEFRPARRVPVRRAAVPPPTAPSGERGGAVVAVALVAVMLGLAAAAGDHEANRSHGPPTFEPIVPPPVIDPAAFDALANLQALELSSPLATRPLARELHLSQISEGELFATGLVFADELVAVDPIHVEVRCRDLAGNLLASPRAQVSCPTLAPGDRCAWMIEVAVPGTIAEVEFEASGQPALELGPAPLDLRSTRPNELEFDRKRELVTFTTDAPLVTDAWATVTAFNANSRVLGVATTRWPAELRPGVHALEVELPRGASDAARLELRVGGRRPLAPP